MCSGKSGRGSRGHGAEAAGQHRPLSRFITLESTVAPTLAPQPPHRIDTWASAARAEGPADCTTADGSGSGWVIRGRSWVYLEWAEY